MKKMLLRSACLVLAIVMIGAALVSCGKKADTPEAPAKQVEFICAFTHGETVSPSWDKACKEIAERSNGAFNLSIHWAQSLLSLPEIPKGLGAGTVTFSNIPINNFPDVFPLNSRVLSLPFMGLKDPVVSSEIYMQLLSEFPELLKEYTDVNIMPIGATTIGMYDLHFTDKNPVRIPSDLKGRQVIPYKLEFMDILTANNAAGSYFPPGQVYEALEKSVCDGYINNWAFQGWFGLSDLIKQHVMFGEYGAFHEYNVLGFNLDFYNSISEENQKMIKDVLVTEGGYAKFWDDTYAIVKNEQEKAAAKDDLIVTLTDEEVQIWKDGLMPTHQATLDELNATRGDDAATRIYNRALELIAEKNG